MPWQQSYSTTGESIQTNKENQQSSLEYVGCRAKHCMTLVLSRWWSKEESKIYVHIYRQSPDRGPSAQGRRREKTNAPSTFFLFLTVAWLGFWGNYFLSCHCKWKPPFHSFLAVSRALPAPWLHTNCLELWCSPYLAISLYFSSSPYHQYSLHAHFIYRIFTTALHYLQPLQVLSLFFNSMTHLTSQTRIEPDVSSITWALSCSPHQWELLFPPVGKGFGNE